MTIDTYETLEYKAQSYRIHSFTERMLLARETILISVRAKVASGAQGMTLSDFRFYRTGEPNLVSNSRFDGFNMGVYNKIINTDSIPFWQV